MAKNIFINVVLIGVVLFWLYSIFLAKPTSVSKQVDQYDSQEGAGFIEDFLLTCIDTKMVNSSDMVTTCNCVLHYLQDTNSLSENEGILMEYKSARKNSEKYNSELINGINSCQK